MPRLRSCFAALLVAAPLAAQGRPHPLAPDDRTRLSEAFLLSDRIGERVWPGWRAVPMPILLVGDSAEHLIGHPAPPPDFVPLGRDTLLDREVLARSRRFPPTMLATFPVAGVPTIVVGSARRSGQASAAWVATLLHEHFHQMQYARPGYWSDVAALDLARGDTTGMWMLEYPFPYDDARLGAAESRLAAALAARDRATSVAAWRALTDSLAPADRRYLEFQLWQEGVARWVEYAAVRAAMAHGGAPSPAFRALPDYEPWAALAERQERDLAKELARPLAELRRVAFYPLGAAMALLLDREGPQWKARYEAEPFRLGAQLVVPARP